MIGTKPMAALSVGLLARKGQARPAMRRADTFTALARAGDDLGWNDMGEGAPAALPPVLAARERLAAELGTPPHARATAPSPGKRVAFTLRLDGERHQWLRQAAAARGVSAQALLTTALDRLAADAA
ncbi:MULTISPECIES: hypothetical protein [unclassified Sphingomonas]|uniref:hypothetical protein n=1 Tax=unclassified Sphingomonas TaxID=196159 RepID=UPI001618E24F|nr:MULTISPECIES: hypothetical protein [unclassified Sphingomonas]MBB3345815.1 hypothetical protein [Sphingomonas sp. BK069]MBB3474590.1 hypothetical protein [Sphingomonas sp. BK345]